MQLIQRTGGAALMLSATQDEVKLLRDTIEDYLLDRNIKAAIPCDEPEWREEKTLFRDLTQILQQASATT